MNQRKNIMIIHNANDAVAQVIDILPGGRLVYPEPEVFIIARFDAGEPDYQEIVDILTNTAANGLGPTMALQYCTYMLGSYSNEELIEHFAEGAAANMSSIVPNDYVSITMHPFTLAYPVKQVDWLTKPMYFLQRKS